MESARRARKEPRFLRGRNIGNETAPRGRLFARRAWPLRGWPQWCAQGSRRDRWNMRAAKARWSAFQSCGNTTRSTAGIFCFACGDDFADAAQHGIKHLGRKPASLRILLAGMIAGEKMRQIAGQFEFGAMRKSIHGCGGDSLLLQQ